MITEGHFPQGDAGAVRLLYMAKALCGAGYGVTVLCRGRYGSGSIDGINYVSLREKKSDFFRKAVALLRFPARAAAWLEKHPDTDAVYLYHNVQKPLFSYCRKKAGKGRFSLLFDCVEWFSPEQFPLGKLSPAYRRQHRTVTGTVDSTFRVIAISRFLEEYFSGKGIDTLRVPMLCEAVQPSGSRNCGETLRLLYAGTAQGKDLVAELLEAALLLPPRQRERLRIDIVGPSRENLMKKCGVSAATLDACGTFLTVHGRVPRERVLEMLRQADFSLLLRDASLRYARAGFPSKVVESLSQGTPVLCNLSSDLGEFLREGENAVIAASHSPKDIAAALERALTMPSAQKEAMGQRALESAARYFDYRNYISAVREFLEKS